MKVNRFNQKNISNIRWRDVLVGKERKNSRFIRIHYNLSQRTQVLRSVLKGYHRPRRMNWLKNQTHDSVLHQLRMNQDHSFNSTVYIPNDLRSTFRVFLISTLHCELPYLRLKTQVETDHSLHFRVIIKTLVFKLDVDPSNYLIFSLSQIVIHNVRMSTSHIV